MNTNYQTYSDKELFELVSEKSDPLAFEQIYYRYVERLFSYVFSRINDKVVSEEIVQEVFISFWQKRSATELRSLSAYLFTAARYKALSHIRFSKVRDEYALNFAMFLVKNYDNSTQDLVDVNDLKTTIKREIDKLPPQCQTAFYYSRFQNYSNKEIAEEMGISIRTVENYITRALKHLRQNLKTLIDL
ncbi:DNA-directed RNA polymerase sigma-70 factor [Prolixibacter bellariivorans]|uniref:DNA-directed RNA polymerase sigma-70 factor n=1 Tax=Prolixibacter bellariivorans TaxID=314319 RepID=A0A5M4B4Z2_9BACT|nr:RNA polymerase sigma-70 factor [Prolixibacter bellariivorans]GET35204.1 DNA-directed RNA polymerase sigma-70 factor [Prolixibacter bellariivorans]